MITFLRCNQNVTATLISIKAHNLPVNSKTIREFSDFTTPQASGLVRKLINNGYLERKSRKLSSRFDKFLKNHHHPEAQ